MATLAARVTALAQAVAADIKSLTTSVAAKLPLSGGTLSGAINEAAPITLASAATVNIGAASANTLTISGTTTITTFDTIAAGARRTLRFSDALTLTYDATKLILPRAANITTVAGDVADFVSLGSGNWACIGYQRSTAASDRGDIGAAASGANTDITSITGNAASATKLASARTLSFTGDATGSFSFDGSAAVSTALTLASSGVTAGTYAKVTVNAKGLVTGSSSLSASDLPSHSTDLLTSGTLPVGRGGTGNVNGTAAAWTTARTLTATGAATGSVSFDGSANISLALTLSTSYLPQAGGTLTGALNAAVPVSIASAATTNIGAAAANDLTVTGTTTITAFDTIPAGAERRLTFAAALTLTHNSTSLILPLAANIVTAAGDVATFLSLGSGNWRCVGYQRTSTSSARSDIGAAASGANTDITTIAGNAATATKLATARTLSFTGDATGNLSFDGTANSSAALTLAASGVTAGTYGGVTVNAKGLVTGATTVLPVANGGTGNTNGTAAAWTTARTLSLTGDGTASWSVDGSTNVSASFTLASTGVAAGTYGGVTVDAKGRVTAATSLLPVSNGGTAASSAAGARVNLGALDSSPPSTRNVLINGALGINQRAFGGGSLSAGVYGFDRWKAGSNGASVSVSSGTITLSSGAIVQVVEADSAAYLAGKAVTFSVEDPSATITVAAVFAATDTTSVSGSIASGSGRKGVTLTLPSGTGNLTVTVSVSASTTFKRMQLELGSVATGWDARSTAFELHLCERYYWQGLPWASGINTPIYTSGGYQSFAYSFPATMRTTPAMTISNSSWSTGNLNTNFGTNGVQVSPNVNGFRILVQSSAAAANCYVDWSGGGYFAADAEL